MKILLNNTPFNSIVTGFVINVLSDALMAVFENEIVMAFVKTVGWFFIIKGFLEIRRQGGLRCPFRGFYRYLFILYLIVTVVMVIRGYTIDYKYQWISLQGMINYHFFSPYYILPYLMPIVAFIPYRYYRLDSFVIYSLWIAWLGIAISFIFYREVVQSSMMLSAGKGGQYMFGADFAYIYTPMSFAILCKRYIPHKIWMWNNIALAFSLLLLLISARRGGAATLSCLFLFNFYFYIKQLRGVRRNVGILLVSASIVGAVSYFNSSSTFDFLRERGFEDTRSGVDRALLNQMSDTELIFGKGLNGRYYYPLRLDDYLDGWRYGSETGFYNIVLKGGYLMALLHIVILFYPALLGMFRSKNLFCKTGGVFLTINLAKLYPFGWLSFNMEFLIVWMLVALCYSKKVRRMTDKDIFNYLFRNETSIKDVSSSIGQSDTVTHVDNINMKKRTYSLYKYT